MKCKYLALILIGVFFMLGLQSCKFPGAAAPTPFTSPAPDLTLTAIFSPVAPTATLPPLVQTATALPTQAVADTSTPTHTPVAPSPTQTPIAPPPTRTPAPTQALPGKTATPTRAVTSTPTRLPITPTARPNVELVAKRLNTPPTIDGDLSEWKLNRAAKYAVYGAGRIASEKDLSAQFAVAWDKDNLYLAVHVKDQKYVQNANGENLYKGDSLEILLDSKLTADYYSASLSGDDFQLGISPGSPAPGKNMEAYLWYPKKEHGKVTIVAIAAKATPDGYDVEVAIPWSVFNITPKENQHFGFAFSVSDDDKSGAKIQESLISNVSTRKLTDPTTWGDLRLGKP